MAALLYQTVWMRQFAVIFGTSELAIATVLSAYMAGLALGSWGMGRLLNRRGTAQQTTSFNAWLNRPVLTYGILECGIAAGALLVPPGMWLVQRLQVLAIGGQPDLPDSGGLLQPLFYAASAMLILLIPTACMGATLPLLSRSVIRQESEIGNRIAILYSVNTLGAVLGTLLAAFLLLPLCGQFMTTLIGVGANLVVFLLAWKLDSASTGVETSPRIAREAALPITDPTYHTSWIPLVMLVSGTASFTYEVLWSRLLGHVIGGSVYAFATMLAAFLSGITLGSLIASPLAKSRTAAWLGLIAAQVGTALTSLLIFSQLNEVPAWQASWTAGNDLARSAWLCGVLLLPSTVCMGATFPFAVRLVTRSADDVGHVSGEIYAWNTIGGVLGAIGAGFWIVPLLGFSGTLRLAVAINFGLALLTLFSRRLDWTKRGVALAAVLLAAILIRPADPNRLLAMSPLMRTSASGELLSLKVGRSSTVRLSDWNGYFLIQNNGLPEALVNRRGAPPPGIETHRWLSGLPLLARPQAESMLVIGFGGGSAVCDLPESLRRIDVIELEPEVIAANRELSRSRDTDPLADPRLHIVLNDARSALALSARKYDVIVSQPSHPWISGASHLYTREFLLQVREHLNEDGVVLQWMDAEFVDEPLFQSVGATLLSVFPEVRLYHPTETSLLFLASATPLQPEREAVDPNGPLARDSEYFAHLPIMGVNDVAAALLLDTPGLKTVCQSASINTDNQNLLAYRTAAHKREDKGTALRKSLDTVDVLLRSNSSLWSDPLLAPHLNPAVITARLGSEGQVDRALAFCQVQTEPGVRELLAAIIARGTGDRAECQQLCAAALQINPQLEDARFLLCESSLNEILRGSASPLVQRHRRELSESDAAVLEGLLAIQQGTLNALVAKEPLLSQVSPNRYAYPYSLYTRAAWRAMPRPGQNRLVEGTEALHLVDQALSLTNLSYGFLIRYNAARMAALPEEQLESVHQCVESLSKSSDDSPEVRGQIDVLRRALKDLESDPRLAVDRVQQVRTDLRDLSNSLLSSGDSGIQPVGYTRQ